MTLLVDVKANALDDGPGIRSVVFFKGCPLSCSWCHNPEAMSAAPELSFDPALCVDAGACRAQCPHDAWSGGSLDRERCAACFDCVDVCPSSALTRIGTPLDVDALVAGLLRHKPFFDASGGGVTLSGGEPTWSMDGLSRVLRALKARGVHTLLQTCGAFSLERYDAAVGPWVDLVYFDLKLRDDAEHRAHCGVSNRPILRNFAVLQDRARAGGTPLLPRVPLVPDVTATAANLEGWAVFLASHRADRVQLLPHNPLWPDKLPRLGRPAPPRGRWMDGAELERCARPFRARGIEVVA